MCFASGCSGQRANLKYERGWGEVQKLDYTVVAAIVPTSDKRPDVKSYPKQIIKKENYSGEIEYDINDRTINAVFDEALSDEMRQLGAGVIMADKINVPLDKSTFEDIRARIRSEYPDAQAAVGMTILDFIAVTKKETLTHDVRFAARVEVHALNIETGKLVSVQYNTEWTDWVVTLDRDYIIGELNEALKEVMKNAIRENMSLRDLLITASDR
jgi:disulfide oxidoreductase YuzD